MQKSFAMWHLWCKLETIVFPGKISSGNAEKYGTGLKTGCIHESMKTTFNEMIRS